MNPAPPVMSTDVDKSKHLRSCCGGMDDPRAGIAEVPVRVIVGDEFVPHSTLNRHRRNSDDRWSARHQPFREPELAGASRRLAASVIRYCGCKRPQPTTITQDDTTRDMIDPTPAEHTGAAPPQASPSRLGGGPASSWVQ